MNSEFLVYVMQPLHTGRHTQTHTKKESSSYSFYEPFRVKPKIKPKETRTISLTFFNNRLRR